MDKNLQKAKREKRIRKKLRAVSQRLRLSVFRSNKYMYAQIIDDGKKETIVGVYEKKITDSKGNKIERAKALGQELAKKALAKKVKEVVFDKGNYSYHGRVKALAEGAREGGLQF